MKEIRALTGLRVIAALIVFWGHTHEWLISRGLSADVPQVIQRLLLSGGRQVDIFFVLSGFIIAYVHGHELGQPACKYAYSIHLIHPHRLRRLSNYSCDLTLHH